MTAATRSVAMMSGNYGRGNKDDRNSNEVLLGDLGFDFIRPSLIVLGLQMVCYTQSKHKDRLLSMLAFKTFLPMVYSLFSSFSLFRPHALCVLTFNIQNIGSYPSCHLSISHPSFQILLRK